MGWSGTAAMAGDEMGLVELVGGGFGGAIVGGCKEVRSGSVDCTKEVEFGAGTEGIGNVPRCAFGFRSPMKSGGGRMKVSGGGGGAIEGGGGINMSPSTRSGTDITDPLDQ